MPTKHVYAPTKGMVTSLPPTMLDDEMSPYMKGVRLKDGQVISDFGHVDFPSTGAKTTNELNGSVMRIDQFYTKTGYSHLFCFTTTCLYEYNTTTTNWDVASYGTLLHDCETAWDAQANVTSTADTSYFLRGSKSAKHAIADAHGTGLASTDDVSSIDISDTSKHTHLSFWIYSSVALTAGHYRIRISEEATGGTGATYGDYNIPATAAATWTHHLVDITAPDASNGGTYPDDFNDVDSVGLVVVTDNGVVDIYLDDIRAIDCFTGDEDDRFSACTMNDTFIFTNGVDPLYKVTDSSGTATTALLGVSLSAGSLTRSEIVITFKDHLVAMNNLENSVAVPQRVTWTNIGALEDWTVGTAGYQDLTNDESWIVAAERLNENQYVIYKERSIILMEWVGGHTPFRFREMISGTGALSKESVVNIGGEHFVFGPDVMYWYVGGIEIESLEDKVTRDLYDSMDDEQTDRVFVMFVEEDDEMQIWLPSLTDYPDDVWCYNIVKKTWYRKDRTMTGFGYYQVASAITIGELTGNIGEQNWKFGDRLVKAYAPITLVGDNNGKVYKLDKTTLNNDGTAITNEWQTPDFTRPDPETSQDEFMRVQQLMFESKGQSVTTDYSTDSGDTWSPTCAPGHNTTTLDGSYKVYQQDFDTVCRKIRFRFRNVSASSGFYLRYYSFMWKPRSGRL